MQAQVSPEVIGQAIAETIQAKYMHSLADCSVSVEFISKIPIAYSRQHCIVGLSLIDGAMPIVIHCLSQWPKLHVLSRIFGLETFPVIAPREEILRIINLAYQQQTGQAQQVIHELDAQDVFEQLNESAKNEDLLDVASRAPVIKLVNLMLFEAVKQRASDVHVQPYEDRLVIRLRVDGILFDMYEPPKHLQQEIVSRIKVMGGMNIAERRLAQDGRATVEVGDRLIDLRISIVPTCFGERAVIRLLDKSARLYSLEELGMPMNILGSFRKVIRRDHGIILVTGPTGSGKSTTLYAALQEINSRQMNVITLEDPIEYRINGISQIQVNEKKGMTFAGGLRNVLRQDPDIIMVGEIRDADTARMAIQSALTGHLVFSTLHTNDAPGAVARILDLGAEPYLVASSLLCVMAQRLVRKICQHCAKEEDSQSVPQRDFRLRNVAIYKGGGCDACMGTGYHDRVGIFELLEVNEHIRELILQRAKASSIKAKAVENGMTTLRFDGIEKVSKGMTTLEEIDRVAAVE